MSMLGEEPNDAAGDHNVESERDTAPESLTQLHRDTKPENIFHARNSTSDIQNIRREDFGSELNVAPGVSQPKEEQRDSARFADAFQWPSDVENRPQFLPHSHSRFREESNKSVDGQNQAPESVLVAAGSWLQQDANFHPPHSQQQDTWRWQEHDHTTHQYYPQPPAHARGNVDLAAQTPSLPPRPWSKSSALTPTIKTTTEQPYTREPLVQPQDSHHTSATTIHAPYAHYNTPYFDYTTSQTQRTPPSKALGLDKISDQAFDVKNRSRPHEELYEILEATRSTRLEDVRSSSQLDEYAGSTTAEASGLKSRQPSFHNGLESTLVLTEPQVKNRSSSTSGESFVCETCGKWFQNRAGLKHHLVLHDPEKPRRHKCNYRDCTAAFRYPKDLKRHRRIHEKLTQYKFVCQGPGCNSMYCRKHNSLRHYRTKHPDNVANTSAGRVADHPWTTPSPANTPPDSFNAIETRLMPPTFMFDGYRSLGSLWTQSRTLEISDAAEPEQGHYELNPDLWDTIGAETVAAWVPDPALSQVSQDSPSLRESATELERGTMDLSHTSQPLPLRQASPLPVEHYDSAETESSPFKRSEIAKDPVFLDTASSSANLPGYARALEAADDTSFDIFGGHHQQSSHVSRGTTFPHHPDDDESSCAESVFSQESTASTATSLGGSLGTKSFLEIVNRTASALFAGDVVHSINSAAVEDPGIGPGRYRRNIRRMIKTFGKSLRAEANTFTERRIAAAMQTRRISTHVALEIMMRTEGPRSSCRGTVDASQRMNEEQHSDTSTDSADEDEVLLTQEPEDEAKIRNFVLDSDACMQFKRTLLDFVHKPYEKRILVALDSCLSGRACHDRDYLARVAREISWVPTNLLCFSHKHSLTVADYFKGYIEDFMGETWNWSPFTARQYPLRADRCRLSWKLPNGEARYIDLPKDVDGAVRDAFDTAPRFLNQVDPSDCHTAPAVQNLAAGATRNSTPTIPLPSHQAGAGKASSHRSGPQTPLKPLGAPVLGVPSGLQLCAQAAQVQRNNHHVYLCVEAGSREFVGLNCAGIQTDIQFFNKIKSEYNSARGWFRLWFSTWRYDHCEFMQFQKTGIGLGARLKIAFPEHTDPLYHYTPKPLKPLQLPPDGPISPDEFRSHYYYQICPSLLSWERWHRRRTGLSLVETEAFDAAPKRVVELDMQNGRREKFYGLYAKEARNALRVAIHMSVCCLPGVIFFFLWLYQWGHGADLQGAAVPVQLSLTLVLGYLGVLYWTR